MLSIQNQALYFKAVNDSNLTRLLLGGGGGGEQLKKKTHLGQVFQSVMSFET